MVIEIDHDWSLKPGAYGRQLKKLLPSDVWADVEYTFVGAAIEKNWETLFRTGILFRDIASIVAARLGYACPHDLDRGVRQYLSRLKELAQ